MAFAPPAGMSEPESAEPTKPSKRQAFYRRLISTLVLAAFFAFAYWYQRDRFFFLIVAVMSFAALVEYTQLFPKMGFRRFRAQNYGVTLAYLFFLFAPAFGFEAAWISERDGLAVAVLVTLVVLDRLRNPIEGFRTLQEIAATVFGFIYCVLLFCFVGKTLMLELPDTQGKSSAPFYVLYLIVVTKFTDIGAYSIGSVFGRDKMIPHISPGKTWQGFAGAIVVAVAASFVCTMLFGEKIPLITPVHAALLAVLIALVAVLGDLAESIVKRSLESKDSGQLMPGIGGMLDLIDSVIFTGPLFYVYLLILQ